MKMEMKSTSLTTHGFKLGSCLLVRLRNKLKETKQNISETNCLHVHVGLAKILNHTMQGHRDF